MEFNELEKRIYKLVCKLGCTIMQQILENQDKEIMLNRDKKEYRHKGYKNNTIKTIMGEIEYKRAIYIKDKEYVFLLDKTVNINTIGKISFNLVEKMLKTVVTTVSYRKSAEEIQNLINETISHEALKNLVWNIGNKIEEKEKQEIELMKQEKLVKGDKEIVALFEEADGLWVNLQGKDRKEQIEKHKKNCEKQGKEYKPLNSVKTELKLHVSYEGWEKDTTRHELVNKSYIAGMMSSKNLEKLRNARIYKKYDEDKIQMRVMNGDGARWIKNIATKDTISQKDSFHIQQEIIRDIIEKEYRQELIQMLEEKKYNEVPEYIENLKYTLGGEEKTIKKLEKLKSYLKEGLPRYQDILKQQGKEIPKAPNGIEYRNMGTMESQIFSVLKVRLMSGRKSFSKEGASYLSKICAEYSETKGNIELEQIESKIQIDNSVEDWIKEIEENVSRNKQMHRADGTEEYKYGQGTIVGITNELKEILKLAEPTALIYR